MGICKDCVYSFANAVKYDENWTVTFRYCSIFKEWVPVNVKECVEFEQID